MEVKDIKSPRYLESGAIDCEVLFDGLPDYVPYTATETDVAETGKAVWDALMSGTFGDITPFTVTPEMISREKEIKRNEINAWRMAEEDKPLMVEYEDHQYQVDARTLQRIDTAASMRNIAGSTFYWGDADNEDVPLTGEQLQGLRDAMFAAVVKRNNDLYKQSRAMKEALDELTDLETIRAFKMPT